MKREQLIKKAKEIEAEYYQEVKDCREFGFEGEKERIHEWTTAIEVMAELIGLTAEESFEIFMNEDNYSE